MRFIHAWSFICARYLSNQLKENHEKRRVYYFGFQMIIGAIVKMVLVIAITLLLGTVIPTLLAILVFGSLRMLAGGYHMDTYGKCIATSLALFIVAGLVAQYTYNYWNLISLLSLIAVSILLGIVVIAKWAPKDTPNKPITKPEQIKKFKRLSFVYLSVWVVAISLLIYFKIGRYDLYIIALSFGLILELFTITPLGYKFFEMISGEVEGLKKKKR